MLKSLKGGFMKTYNEFCLKVANLAIMSLLFEVSATPKPGLVDRNNSGAHNDMNFYTFMSSSSVLFDTFYLCALEGVKFGASENEKLLKSIRPIGISGEERMLKMTNGVNTHKGLIFSLGIISAAAGSIFAEGAEEYISAEQICERVKIITKGICKNELAGLAKKDGLTYGEKLYFKYGSKGIRGEVETGFKTVLDYGLPVIKEYFPNETNTDKVLVQVLLNLVANTEDSNILGRHDFKTLKYSQRCAKKALELGGAYTHKGLKYLKALDKDFIKKHISPGGSADLLAVTVMLYFLEKGW